MRKILIVEDESSIAQFIVDVVQMFGFEHKIASSGTEALETAKSWKPDIITLDLMIPPPDGLEVLSDLKKDPETRAIPVFVVSVVAKRSDLMEQVEKADGVFEKPLNVRQFIEKLKEISDGPKS